MTRLILQKTSVVKLLFDNLVNVINRGLCVYVIFFSLFCVAAVLFFSVFIVYRHR